MVDSVGTGKESEKFGPVVKHWQYINKEMLANHLYDNIEKILKYLYKYKNQPI